MLDSNKYLYQIRFSYAIEIVVCQRTLEKKQLIIWIEISKEILSKNWQSHCNHVMTRVEDNIREQLYSFSWA